jgi:hypothetical protein
MVSMSKKPPPTASADPPGPPDPSAPDPEAIRDRLLRAADLRSKYLLEQAESNPKAFKGAWELQILIYAVSTVVEGDNRALLALAKLGPDALKTALATQEALRKAGGIVDGAGSPPSPEGRS